MTSFKSDLPLHSDPTKVYPVPQVHVKEPMELTHVVEAGHLGGSDKSHSLISEIEKIGGKH